LPKDVTEEEFTEKMSKCGKVLSFKLKDQEQKSQTGEVFVNFKIGYVLYEDVKQAQKCI
jgi:RNA recognition motif-containing protein